MNYLNFIWKLLQIWKYFFHSSICKNRLLLGRRTTANNVSIGFYFEHLFFQQIDPCHLTEALGLSGLELPGIYIVAPNLLWRYKSIVFLKKHDFLVEKNIFIRPTSRNGIGHVFDPASVHFWYFFVIPFFFVSKPESTGIDFLVHSTTRNYKSRHPTYQKIKWQFSD